MHVIDKCILLVYEYRIAHICWEYCNCNYL